MLHRRRTGRWRHALVLVAAIALASSGCGARWTDEQRASVVARGESTSGGGAAAAASGAGGAAVTGVTTGAGASGAGTAGGTTGASGGSTASAGSGGAAAADPAAAASSLPCSAPTDAPGVTDTEIGVGNINTLSGPVPGLGASFAAAVRAYVDHRNSIGGVCGRQIALRQADDGLDNGRNRALFAEMEPDVLAFVSGNAAGNGGGAEIINNGRIPAVGTGVSPEMDAAPTYYPVNPLNQRDVATPKYRWLVEQGVSRAAVVYVSAAVSAAEGQRQITLMRASGIEIVFEQSLPLATLSFDSVARGVANSGADYLYFVHADSASASMAQSMADTGYEGLEFEEYIVAYGSNFIELAGGAAEGATSWIFSLPSEDGGAVPEQAAFLEWMALTAPDESVDTFAALGWASAKTLFDTMEAVQGPLSRDAILAQLDATGRWDAGGLVAPIQLGAKASEGCQIAMIVEGGAWRRLNPPSGFLC